jgi:uncharacterized protein (TIGR03435 family)
MIDRIHAGILIALFCGASYAQELAHKFEVASIKRAQPEDHSARGSDTTAGGVFDMNTTVRTVVQMAYKLQDYQLAGEPKWVNSDYYRIIARPPSGAPPNARTDLMSERLRYLLEERFQFAAHHETRQQQQYTIVIAKGGSKLQEAEQDAANFRLSLGKGKIATRGGAKVELLARLLSNQLQAPVIDKTGLGGYYNIHLDYTTADGQPDNGASIFAALQDQLGLKLEAGKGPVDVLVIDRVERPSEN